MRLFVLSLLAPPLLALPLLAACQEKTQGDAVRQAYDNKAAQIDRQAEQQPTKTARDIYHDQADAYREEGKDREKGLEGRSPSSGPTPPSGQPAPQ
ncbi:hypothetical protein [Sphingomonas oryzagri]|jgi:hypothetical protein|uniref:Lipoprotein n=1 Tax=Sphingomonas oryzagri TaxID=3042314 RepID=A0ABT6N693_9SPHN|nr:hypothetical protein [Sphingomonas oryzagri]MDH7640639.1 hypothetical protein [Sphingomonas oryzagri]